MLKHALPRTTALPFLLLSLVVLSACSSDSGDDRDTPATDPDPVVVDPDPVVPEPPIENGFEIGVPETPVALVEGAPAVSVPVTLRRGEAFTTPVSISLPESASLDSRVRLEIVDATLEGEESATSLQASVPLSTAPIDAFDVEVTLRVAAGSDVREVPVTLSVEPTSRPDIYLLIGQSNIVGESEPGSLAADEGQPDAPDPRIRQLNVTANTADNFATVADFTDRSANIASPAIVTAADPLHGVSEEDDRTQIGPGLSFAKAALADTEADIVLVPAGYGGTGFCGVPAFPNAWNADASGTEFLGGTGLFDRAVLRTNVAIEESGGILRGILWIQGERDGMSFGCARAYEENLVKMVAALRTRIDPDARGEAARGEAAPVPFVAGTLSRGNDARGDFSSLDEPERIVADAIRNVGTTIPAAAVSNHDDLVPPAYPCGAVSCLHFGAAAYRIIGQRLYDRLDEIAAELDR